MNFYFGAAETIDRLDKKQGSIKGILASLPEKDRKRTSALVIETLKYKPVLNELISTTSLLKEERKKLTQVTGPIKQAILRHKTRLQAELTKLKIRRGVSSNTELAQIGIPGAADIPRYVRVNTLRWSMQDALTYFKRKGFVEKQVYDGSSKSVAQDSHIPDLLLFHPSTSFQDEPAYKSGKLILQDKASCFPAVALAPPNGSEARVIDATAAPGNKTSHLSALMKGQGKVFAFELDRKRFGTLQKMLDKAQCTNVEPINLDFLTVDPKDSKYQGVTHILLDPSCSGSGIVNRLDYLLDSKEQDEDEDQAQDRLHKLASFQLGIIRHAMTFTNVQRIVYSTCSIHAIENEHVVAAALASEEARNAKFVLAPQSFVIPSWPRRGLEEHLSAEDCQNVIRCEPAVDATNGFFVSCFVRESQLATTRGVKRLAEDEDDSTPARKKKKKKKRKRKDGEIKH
ncbi:S-adenosyl-L-methionine-dependent methyltransferase [Flagelloscypha sp. PMI_526]|nr:S-adenosyl-L-methionine-dependent methyltransferase [Flagelloscypha sp. PMI_526]